MSITERLLKLAVRLQVTKDPPFPFWVRAGEAMKLPPNAKMRSLAHRWGKPEDGLPGFPDTLEVALKTDGYHGFAARATHDGKKVDFGGPNVFRPWPITKHAKWPPEMDLHGPPVGKELQEFIADIKRERIAPGFTLERVNKSTLYVSLDYDIRYYLDGMQDPGGGDVRASVLFLREFVALAKEHLLSPLVLQFRGQKKRPNPSLRILFPGGFDARTRDMVESFLRSVQEALEAYTKEGSTETPTEGRIREALSRSTHWDLDAYVPSEDGKSVELYLATRDASNSFLAPFRKGSHSRMRAEKNAVSEFMDYLGDWKDHVGFMWDGPSMLRFRRDELMLSLHFRDTRPLRWKTSDIYALVHLLDTLPGVFSSEDL